MNRRTVMVVDDNALMRKLLRLTLEGERFAVLDHADGGAALAAATAELPDLVIQDLVLGDMSGLDLVRALRELPGGEELPIIAVTGLPSHAMEARDERTFDQVLVKPVSPARLLEVVRELLPADVPPRRPAGAAPTVLVVDHHREDARALTAHLAERGFVVAVAADALEAMTAARNRRPDAILSALVTAHGDGFALCRWIREEPSLAGVPVLLLGHGDAGPRNAAVARALGADALLDRSAGHDAIVDRVEDCLRGAARAPDDGQAAAIRRLTQVMARRPELARALEETLYMLADLTGGCAGGVLRRQERGWTLVSQVGTSPGLATLARSGDALDALAAGCQVRDLAACERGQDVLRVLDAGGGVLVPLCARGRVLGALVIAFAAVGPCTDDSLALMQVVATEIALAIAVDDAAHAAGRADAERERRQLERQVQQLQRLDAIGRLTGGVAHDFNNILAVILATSHILMETLEADDPRRADAEEIEKAGERGAMLARQLLTFSRREPGEPTSVDVGAVLHDLESMIRRLIGKEITLAIEIDPELGVARADVAQLEQVVMNLAVNARDAMPTGGTLTLAASNVELDGAGPGQAGGRHIALTVSDTGCGMDARTRDRAFEPFFTTRAASGGSGLGLSTVRDIVTRAGGQLRLSSEPGLGTSVSVYLPRTDGTDGPDGHDGHDGHDGPDGHAALRRAPDAPLGAHRGTETLLVVDGDDRVRATVARVLGGAGYRVLVARDGAAAAQVAGRHDGALALVLTNIVMAGMSAPALMVELRRRWPGVRALFMSGYADHTMVRGLEHGPDTALLQKPFTPEALTRRIRELLDA